MDSALPPRRLRILILVHTLELGGGVVTPVRLACALAKHHDVWVAAKHVEHQHPAMIGALREAGIPALGAPWLRPSAEKWTYRLARPFNTSDRHANVLLEWLDATWLRYLHRRHSFDVVNTHLFGSELRACRAFRRSDLPIVATDHGDCRIPETVAMLGRPAVRAAITRTDAVVVCAHANKPEAARFPRGSRCEIHVIANPIVLPPENDVVQRTPSGEVIFGMVARGHPQKGWNEAVEAFLRVAQECSGIPVRLLLVGGGSELDRLQARVPAWARPSIEFAGEQGEPAPWIKRMDIGLLPSYFPLESLPNTVMEYLAWGKPVLATDVGDIRRMLETPDGSAGICVPIGPDGRADVDQLSQAMKTLAEKYELRQTFATRALLARRKFDSDAVAGEYEQLFLTLLRERRGRRIP